MRVTADYPPVWLAGFAALGWGLGRAFPHGPAWLVLVGAGVIAAGLLLMALAALTMARRGTTVDPHGQPRHLVTDSVFAWSRNPIYLADCLILVGLCLAVGAPLAALPLVAGFATIITRRFIRPEEARLAAAFPDSFPAYRRRTRRWL